MPDEDDREAARTYARAYARRRRAEDPEFRLRRQEANRESYRRRLADPAFAASLRERRLAAYAARKAQREALQRQPRRGSAPGFDLVVGTAVRSCRKAAGLSATDVGARLGLTRTQIAKYERGETTLTSAALFELATLFGVSVDAFFPERRPDLPVPRHSLEETQAVARAYEAIGDATVRARFLDLLTRLAELGHDEAGAASPEAGGAGG